MTSMRSSAQPRALSRAAAILVAGAAIAFGGAWHRGAGAAVLQVSPVRVQFGAVQNAQSLQVFNSGKDDLNAQVRIMRWTQENGADKLVPASEIVASPAIMRVSPGQRQTVRIVRLHPSATPREQSYRVLIDELPPKENPRGLGLKVLLRYSIPVFVDGTATAAAGRIAPGPVKTDLSQLRARVVRNAAGATEFQVRNDGPQAARISGLVATLPGGQAQTVEAGLVGYVLPGRQMGWRVKLPYPMPSGMTLKARFNDDVEAQNVPLDEADR
ncbi:MAG: molecular chaperone [Achromobacter sp.]|uniref:fimbrial biogenesis chaperone n=1 Tax=Achromobacter sp. TaxID=134375 RepID=UPI003D02CDE9